MQPNPPIYERKYTGPLTKVLSLNPLYKKILICCTVMKDIHEYSIHCL